jgi:myosin-5
MPYSRVSDIVIAVNPYQWLTDLYTEEVRMHYAQKIVWDTNDQDPRIGLPPHLYEVSSLCYKGLAVEKVNQSILVSGESGAGKTETVKICMNHIATVQQDPNAEKSTGDSAVVTRILDSNPLLESFGNAKTRRNDNSSRFGKYIMLQFHHIPLKTPTDKARSALAGSTCEVYLLEKSRVVFHDDTERSYHIFYQLLAAPDEVKTKIWKGLKGTKNESFVYIGTPPHVLIDGLEDADHFPNVVKALELVGVKGDDYLSLFQAIAAVLQLGNLTFAPKPGNDEETVITSNKEFKDLAELIGIDLKILELAFTERTIKTRGEEYKVPLKSDISKESSDAFAKEIYAKVFLWLVRAINDATCAENNYPGGKEIEYGMIGLLDIFGFESFPINGFEQLCINYCNEKLQQKFTRDIFASVQEEYKAEGLNLDDIKYDDNSDVLELIEGKLGLIKQLNEECVRPKGNDQAFVSKALQSNKGVPCLIQKNTFSKIEFGVHHFAGAVIYRAQDFVIRNTDTLPADLQSAAKLCKNDIIANHLDNTKCSNFTKEPAAAAKAAPRRAKSSLTADTVMTQFKTQLAGLMKGLALTKSRYVRCVKPNTKKRKLVMEHITTMEQLRCAGVVAAVLISRSAYPSKLNHDVVLNKYGMLNEGKPKGGYPDADSELVDLLNKTLKHLETEAKDGSTKKGYALGKSRVYFRAGCLEYLESERSKIWDKWAIKCQKIGRSFLVKRMVMRMKYEKYAGAVLPIQCLFRRCTAVQAVAHCKKDKKRAKRMGKKSKKAAIRIQAIIRGFIQIPRYKAALLKKKEEGDLANQLVKMQDKLAEAEDVRKRDIEDAKFQFEQEMDEYKEKLEDELRAEAQKQNKSAQQQTLIDESGKIIEYLRKENMKLRQQCESMKKDYKSLKENNARLMEANASASSSFNQLNDHAKGLNATNARLIKNVETYKKQLVKMKEDLKNRQAFYLAEAHARVAYQKTLARIVAQVQDKSRDAQLVEDVVIWALECEAEAKSERAALENAGQSAPPGANLQPAAPKVSAHRPTDSDSDDDSDSD